MEDIFEDEGIEVNDSSIHLISQLAREQLDQEAEVAMLEEKLKMAKSKLRKISEVDLPAAMSAAKVKDFTLENGAKIKIDTQLYASLPKSLDKKNEAIQWLIDNGQAAIVDEDIILHFSPDERAELEQAMMLLRDANFQPMEDRSVNTSRVKSVIKELQEQGIDVPLEKFGAYWRTFAKIKV